ncbi:hypothetical protein FW800_26680 [Pseudomonas sp. 910_23]|uniref:Uncharacterized protein n=1 Tax=Pseudomonas synxantha TaxID=47883 RepID=A0A5D3GIX5_9PSED|nr:hypothetical protein [Pseudomonas sp. W2Aug9]MCK3832338.1 hypothetical protein [Pseudomonas fluorescens]MCK3837952.1 hypothetical protein [Pseudomonas sp. NCIMB 10586]MCK3843628.1 hypothetical protein [Pseudomonas sp. W15Feb34]MCK3850234.1 hypothetical protein [Pseudomonas sp. W2Jun17]MCK3862714.1 hypothetical protein [Pseudomonas sp. B329]TYK60336.1 hypothetical protein FXO26_04265 [Pseudomonas synxantha]
MKERRRMRFIRMMKRNTGTREKMWAGHTAPFFACRKVKTLPSETQKGPQGAFWGRRRYQRSRSAILPFLPSHSAASGIGSLRSVIFGQISANSTFS